MVEGLAVAGTEGAVASLRQARPRQLVVTGTIASVDFFVFLLIAAAAVEFLLRPFAGKAGVNPCVFAMAPVWFAMPYSHVLYQSAERTIQRLRQIVSRGNLVTLMTRLSFAALANWTWCQPRDFLTGERK
jgi:hypothetical protein